VLGVLNAQVSRRDQVRVDRPFSRSSAEPSRPVGTAAEVVERVVRFVVRFTNDWCRKDADRARTDAHKPVSSPEMASRESRSSAQYVQKEIAQTGQTFIEFPPMQKGASN